MNNKSIVIILGIVSFIFGLVALQQRTPQSIVTWGYADVENINVDSAVKNHINNTKIFEVIDDTIKKQKDENLKDTLFVKKKILGTESCRFSADGFSIDIPVGSVKSEREIIIRGLHYEDIHTIDASIINVTSNYAGYRCLPHGKFEKDLRIGIGYDTSLIPEGYYPTDIRTFFYDEEKQLWDILPIDSIDFEKCLIVSRTDHFTDFINGILKQPEIPDAEQYTPTSIRNLEYANPLEGMTIMEPPVANNSGNCSMNYPIIVPVGRNGMTPQISISYSSDVKDGIMGIGWNLNIPNITIDTRWGVPSYSPNVESESYLVNGEAIVEDTSINDNIIERRKPLFVKNGVNRNMSGIKKYAYLTEGKFDKIIRHGDSPKNYWWEVTDREGVKYVYGDSNGNTPYPQFSLYEKYPSNNIAVWGLAEATDTYGNFIRYTYEIDSSGAYEDRQFRITNIMYTGYGDSDGPYKIYFEYTDNANALLSARYGFLTSDKKLLSKITITYNNNTFVKCYRFEYANDAMSRKVLKAIAEITDENKINDAIDYNNNTQKQGFYVHFFDYYDENSIGFQEATQLNIPSTEAINILGYNVPNDGNISKNTSYSITGGGSANVGFNDDILTSKSNTFGINYHYTFGRNNQKSQIMDLNGDGIVDRVEKTASDGVKFYRGERIGNNGNISFSSTSSTLSIPRLSKSTSHTHSIGTELLLSLRFVSGMVGYSYSRTKDINSDFFIDINGDGYTDYVSDGNVYLNFPDQNGNPAFTDMSSNNGSVQIDYDNCYSFGSGGQIGISNMEEETSSAKRDPVIVWKSPLDCYYDVTFSETRDDGINTNIDNNLTQGITVVLPNDTIDTCIYKDCPHYFCFCNDLDTVFKPIYIRKGGYILFHIHSDKENTVENLRSKIIINAVPDSLPNYALGYDTTNAKDADNKRVLHFRYDEDAVIQDGKPFTAMQAGSIKLSAYLNSGTKSDTLNYCLMHEHYNASDRTYTTTRKVLGRGQNIVRNLVDSIIIANQYDRLSFILDANSNVDWSDIAFTSKINYVEGTTAENDTATYHPSLGMSIYSKQLSLSKAVVLEPTNYSILPDPSVTACIVSYANENATAYLTAKTANNIIAKKKIFENGQIISGTLNFNLPSSQEVYFDYTINGNINVPDSIYYPATVSISNSEKPAGFYAQQSDSLSIFGNFYRGWGQFSYKDDSIVVDSFIDGKYYPISFAKLQLDTTTMSREDMEAYDDSNSDFAQLINSSSSTNFDASSLDNFINNGVMGNVKSPKFEPMSADISKGVWTDPFGSAFVSKEHIGSGYGTLTILHELENNELAEEGDYIPDFSNPLSTHGNFPLVNRVSRNISHSFSVSALNALGYNYTRCESFGLSDMMDMNGDGYPDIVTSKQIQYTLPNGNLSDSIFTFANDREVNTSYSNGETSGASVSFKPSTLLSKTTNPNSTEKNICTTAGLNNNESDNKVLGSYLDINSDGLPDIVYFDENNNPYVEYNLGYKFSPRFQISNLVGIARNISNCGTWTVGADFNFDNYSISGGINSNSNTSYDIATMTDINSDGFIDIVSVQNNTLYIYLNNGTGFGTAQTGNLGISKLSENKTYNISGNISGTIGFPIMYVKITASLYADFSYNISNEKLRLMDLNGDGAIDILSIGDNGATVRYGIPQKHDLLKKVITPALGKYEMYYSMLYSDINNPSSKWIMTGLKIRDNDGGFSDGHDSIQYNFEYSDMKYHRIERESYGFAEVVSKIVDNCNSASPIVLRQQKESFHTENGLLHGLKYREEIRDANNVLQTSTNYNWTLNDLNTGAVVTNPDCGGELYPRLESDATTIFGTSTSNTMTSAKRYEYTKYGNVSKYISRYKHNDSVTAIMTYEPDRGRNMLGIMTQMTVKSASDITIRKTERRYNNNGNIVLVKNYLSDNEFASIDFTYDIYGNLTRIKYPANNIGQRASYNFNYEDETHTYISKITDTFGCYTQLLDYDYRFGKPARVKAKNGEYTLYTYYSDGKLASVKVPTDLVYSARFEYWDLLNNQNKTRWARVIHHDTINAGNTFITQTICDGLGRTMQTVRKSVVNGSVKFVVSGKNVYDAYGRITSTYQPQTTDNGANGFLYNSTFNNPTTYTYDCLDRQLSATTPDGITVCHSYDVTTNDYGDSAMLTTSTYPQGRILKSYKDSRGLQITAKAVRNAGDIVTSFSYSAMGELLSSIDPDGYTTTYKYDMLGRLVRRNHPDAGDTYFRYDKAGNLISKKTQKLVNTGDSISYNYKYNRLMSIEYPHNPQMNVYYEYGDSLAGHQAGLVTRRQDGVCVQSYLYNAMGDVVENVRTFAMPSGNLMTFATSWEYDTWGRTKSMTYPDGETIVYRYDNAGKVTGMYSGNTAIVSNIKYDKYGNRTRIEYGNNTYNTYTYDTLSLQLKNLSSYDASNTALQNITYTYDNLYNITKAENSATGYIYTHNYAYDTLNRVISSTGYSTIGSETPTYNFAISYSPSGRILNYTLTGDKLIEGQLTAMNIARTYSYTSTAHLHAPTSIGPHNLLFGTSYSWDANGNFKRTSGINLPSIRNAYFNEENRLAAIGDWRRSPQIVQVGTVTTGNTAAYLYSADGERVWKFTGTATATYSNYQIVSRDLELDKTFYPTPQTTLDKRFFYKHYFIGSERICTNVGQFYMTAANTPPHVGFVNPNTTAGSFIAAFTQTVSHALDSVGYSGYIAIDPDFNCITTSPHFRTKTYYYHYNHQGSVALVTYQNGTLQQHLQYLPYGGTFVDQQTSSYASTYTFSAKEKDAESGYTYFGARYYSDNIMQWLSVDPMSDMRPGVSPYSYCQNNPIGRIDPSGALDGDYYNTRGKYIGSDGQEDHNVYVVFDKNDINMIKANRKFGKSTDVNAVKSATKLPSYTIRKQILEMAEMDRKDNFREYGGVFGLDEYGNEHVVWAKPGERSTPPDGADIDVFNADNVELKDLIKTYLGTFHSHPSGIVTISENGQQTNGETFGITKTQGFSQVPSDVDISNARQRSFVKGDSYVFGARYNEIYIYNGNNNGYKTMNADIFGKIGTPYGKKYLNANNMVFPYDTTNTYNMHIRLYFNGKENDFSNFEIMFFVKDSISHKIYYYKPIIKDNCIEWNNIQEISEHIDVIYRYKKRYFYMPNCVFSKNIRFNLIINIDYKPYTVTKEKNGGVYTWENYETTYRNTRKHIDKLAYKTNVIGVNMLVYIPLEEREGYDYYSLLYRGESNKSKKVLQNYLDSSQNITQ